MKSRLQALADHAAVNPEERHLAGVVSGLLYLIGGLTLASLLLLRVTLDDPVGVLVLAGGAVLWGLVSIALIDWWRTPRMLIHCSTGCAFGAVAAAVVVSGSASSPAWIYLVCIGVFAACFYPRRIAIAYLVGCVLVHALPLLYDPQAGGGRFLAQMVIADGVYIGLAVAVVSGRRLMWRLRKRAESVAEEQRSLRRVATAVITRDPPDRIYALVAGEMAGLLGAGAGGILRLEEPAQAIVMGSWSDRPGGHCARGTGVPILPASNVERALQRRMPVRIVGHSPDSPVGRLGYTSSIVAPISVNGEPWGVLAVTAAEPKELTRGDEQRLMKFGDVMATAIESIEDRARLAAQAATDPLTGLANRRTFHQRLASEAARAIRHDTPLSVAVIDIDHFKAINDNGGHDAGDAMLVEVAACLSKLARTEDTLGRLGGDEFAWILPETSGEQALVAVERARRVIARAAPEPYRMSVSAGICDTGSTVDPAELIRFADGALYWSKAHGRDQCWTYNPAVASELSVRERAERLEHSQALLGLRALARAIDARDAPMREHSERVATLARQLALSSGWSPARALLLSEAALVHDVGKVAVPDAILRKPGSLSDDEQAEVMVHAELSARIVEGVLSPEQVEWIRAHHERPDGCGYPNGLAAEEIPEGASLLAIADAWDVMTTRRRHGTGKSIDDALKECAEQDGAQFTSGAVAALLEVHRDGALMSSGAGAGEPAGLDAA